MTPCGRDKTPADRAQGWMCTRPLGHSGPCAMVPPSVPVPPAALPTPRPFAPPGIGLSLPEFVSRLTPTEAFNRDLAHQRMADELEKKILADREAHPAPVPLKVKPRWFRLLLFPLTMRKFERVFFTQGEGFFPRWWKAVQMSRLTIRH